MSDYSCCNPGGNYHESDCPVWGSTISIIHSPEREGREGDSQPMPTLNHESDIQTRVQKDIEVRRKVGIQRYGTPLQPFNGRDALLDAL